MKREFLIYVLLGFLLAVMFNSCKTIKKITTSKKRVQKIEELSTIELVKKVQSVQPTFKRAYIKKMSANLQIKDRNLNVQATCKLVQDSAIHISIQPFMGIELFKVELTPKSMFIIDKMNKVFYKSNYGIFYELLGINIDYDEIEALMSNRLFVPNEKVINLTNFTHLKDTTKVTLVNKTDKLYQAVTINNKNGRIVALLLKQLVKKWTMKTEYSNFKQFDELLFPQNIDVFANGEGKRVRLQFQIRKVVFDKNFIMKESRLSKYRQGDIRMLLKNN